MAAPLSGRILVVDDHPTNRLKLSMAVKKLGHEVEVAEDGGPALELLRDGRFDLLLLDIEMPGMNGYQVLEAMKADGVLRDIPVIVISAFSEMENIVKAIELGAMDFLPKTFDRVLFEARLNACLEKKRLRDLEVEYLRQVASLTDAASLIEAEDFEPSQLDLADVAGRSDALGGLARVIQDMAGKVYQREQSLKRQVQELRIEIDKTQQSQQVKVITGTDYFRDLRGRANELRNEMERGGDVE